MYYILFHPHQAFRQSMNAENNSKGEFGGLYQVTTIKGLLLGLIISIEK